MPTSPDPAPPKRCCLDYYIDPEIIRSLQEARCGVAESVASILTKFNKIAEADPEMAIVRARRALDAIIRSACILHDLEPGTRPLETLFHDLGKKKVIPAVVERHAKTVKEFGNLAAHGDTDGGEDQTESELTEDEARMCALSISIVAKWYLQSITPLARSRTSFTAIQGRDATEDMIRETVDLDARIYPPEYRVDLDRVLTWFRHNPDIYTLVRDDSTHRIIGYINAMPLKEKMFEQLAVGETIDVEMEVDMIRKYDLPDFYRLYIASIAVDDAYHGQHPFQVLMEGYLEKLILLSRHDIYISEVLADAVSPMGEKVAQWMGLPEQRATTHQSKIFRAMLMPPSLRVTTNKGKQLVAYYREKYEAFKGLSDIF